MQQSRVLHTAPSNASSSRPTTNYSDLSWPSTTAPRTSGSASSTLSFGKLPTKHSLRNPSWSISADTRSSACTSSNRSSPRFSKLLGTVLGSPFATTSDVMVDGSFASVPSAQTVTRPPSPALSLDFSLVSPPSPSSLNMPNVVLDVFSGPSDSTPPCSFFVSPVKRAEASPLYKTPSRCGKGLLPRLWDALSSPSKKNKRKAQTQTYDEGLPLDGEEGELIDDEACFIDASTVIRIDILSRLPTELGLYLLLFLDLPSVLACHAVSQRWRALANDNLVWRELFYRRPGWAVDAAAARRRLQHHSSVSSVNSRVFEDWSRGKIRPCSAAHSDVQNSPMRASVTSSTDGRSPAAATQELAPLSLNWVDLYKTRLELDNRWINGEPKTMRLSGHEDSVYCLEFDSQKIITGSRDKTIKIWSLRTGKLYATLRGHAGSVLCLKFDPSGFMVSGSSDCTVFVWDLNVLKSGAGASASELVQRVLRGHSGGVLDLRIDANYIVSCSKDGLIRVWSRKTLTLATTLRGHEGPVNAVGMQDGKVVSASGDGKMMLWDIASSTRVRTLDGHDRGLACIELKNDLIVSGGNDCKIKVWSAATGECLKTLVGHDLLVRALSFDPAAGRLVSASYDRTVKVWDLPSGRMVREFKNSHSSQIFDVKFDACRVVSTSHDQKVVVLDFSHDLDTSLFL